MTYVELSPTAIVAGGAALARNADGRVVFVEGALPGERVRALITDERKDFARAIAVDVLEASPDRVAPPCAALEAGCGGCSWQHVARPAQAQLKIEIVTDALRRIARFDQTELPTITVAPIDDPVLRTTAHLGVDADGRAGHRRSRGNEVVAPDDCAAVHPLLEELVLDGRFHGAREVTLRVGVASRERTVLPRPASKRLWSGFELPSDVSISGVIHEEVAGRTFQVSAASFFQPGPVAAAALVESVDRAIGDALTGGRHLLDAYAGVGLLGSVLGSRYDVRVTAIEHERSAVSDARVNLGDLDARVAIGEVARWQSERSDRVDAVVADPARPGLGRPGVAALAATGARRLVLVSCDPASFARDTLLLTEAGFRLSTIELVGSFPDTFHVETVARFDASTE